MLSSPLTMRRRASSQRTSADPVPRSGPPRSCYVAVLGCSGPRSESQTGVGKSALCARFVNPGLDAYNAVKPDVDESVLAWMDFVEPEINQEHFLYYGSSARRLSGNTTAVIHVVEQTEFLDEVSVGHTAYPTPGTYLQRATMRYLQSPGKIAYTRRGNIGAGMASGAKPLPTALSSKGLSGYVLVYDPTARDDRKQQQLTLLAKLVERLPRDLPIILAITKCDSLAGGQLDRLAQEHEELARCLQQRNRAFPVVHVSAEIGVNVDLLFMLLASRALGVEIGTGSDPSVGVSSYQEAHAARHTEIRELQRELSGAVMDLTQQFQTRWHPVYQVLRRMPAYRRLSDLEGYEGVRRLFLARLLEIKMEDLKNKKETTPPPPSSGHESDAEIADIMADEDDARITIAATTVTDNQPGKRQKTMYEALEKSLEQHPDVKCDAKQVSDIYEDLEAVKEARTWPRQSTALARVRDSRGAVYFPITTEGSDRSATLPSNDGKQRHGSCPTFRKDRPTTLVLDADGPPSNASTPPKVEVLSQSWDDMPEISQTHTSPRLNNKNQSRPRSVSPRHRSRGLLNRFRKTPSPSPASSADKPDPVQAAQEAVLAGEEKQHVEVRHTRSHSLQMPQSNELSPSQSMPTVSVTSEDNSKTPGLNNTTLSSAKSLPYLPIVIPLKPNLVPRHARSASMHNPAMRVSSTDSGSSRQHFPLAMDRRSPAPVQKSPYMQYGMSNIYAQPLKKIPVPKDVPSPIYRELEAAVADLHLPTGENTALDATNIIFKPAPVYAELEANAAEMAVERTVEQPQEDIDPLLNTLV
ncbi:uncharacterized protein LOC135805647 [Sycon ciliatum]|uniref:uncharacterized protein LOC135805647 n=1 Tax=Sycon ciliatum TaxID=27933 RepID=UPI0031F71F19